MTKAELVANIAKKAGMQKGSAERVLNVLTNSMTKALKKGDKLTLTGFGTFSVAKRRARTGRNPQTGKEIKIPATRVARFKAGKELRGTVSGYERALGQLSAISPIVYKCPRCSYRRYLRIPPSEPPRCRVHGGAMRRER